MVFWWENLAEVKSKRNKQIVWIPIPTPQKINKMIRTSCLTQQMNSRYMCGDRLHKLHQIEFFDICRSVVMIVTVCVCKLRNHIIITTIIYGCKFMSLVLKYLCVCIATYQISQDGYSKTSITVKWQLNIFNKCCKHIR